MYFYPKTFMLSVNMLVNFFLSDQNLFVFVALFYYILSF